MATEAELEQLHATIQRLSEMQGRMKSIASQVKDARTPIKASIDEAQEYIKNFMRSKNSSKFTFQEKVFELKTTERKGSLTRKTLLPALERYFGNPTDAKACFDAVNETLGSSNVEVLRQRKAPKGRGKKKGATDSDGDAEVEDAEATGALNEDEHAPDNESGDEEENDSDDEGTL